MPSTILAHVIDSGDVFVIESGRALGLVLKALGRLLVVAVLLEQNLHRHRTPQGGICTPKHGTHTTTANEGIELEVVEFLALEQASEVRGLGMASLEWQFARGEYGGIVGARWIGGRRLDLPRLATV